jgi:hypothetical protein
VILDRVFIHPVAQAETEFPKFFALMNNRAVMLILLDGANWQ